MNKHDYPQVHSIEAYEAFWKKVWEHPDRYNPNDLLFEWNLELKDIDDPRIREMFGSNTHILDEWKMWHGKEVYEYKGCTPDTSKIYILCGVQVTNEGFYWILRRDNTVRYLTCSTRIIPIEEWKE